MNLDNEENPSMTKKFWVSFTFDGDLPQQGELVSIASYYDELDEETDTMLFSIGNGLNVEGNCAWLEASLLPQPDRESFVIALGNPNGEFSVNCVQLATKCVPIPSTLLLLGGGLVGLIGVRKKLKSR